MFMIPKSAGSADTKQYKITDTIGLGLPETAAAGELVLVPLSSTAFSVIGSSNIFIPNRELTVKNGSDITYVPDQICFVMPAEDVTIS